MEKFILKEKAGINVAALSETFEKTTNSYKFLWLYSLLEILKQREYNSDSPIAYRDVFYSMLRHAQKPCQQFHMSLGATDQLCHYVQKIEEANGKKMLWSFEGKSHLDNPAFIDACDNLSNYVPTRWIHPFVHQFTAAARAARNESRITERIIQVAAVQFEKKLPPPYYIQTTQAGNEIFIHPKWAAYFAENEEIIRGWCLWNFAQYLQKHNPNMPNIINKIIVDEKQVRHMTNQRQFWRAVIEHGGDINCIYSGYPLKDGFDLDHYVPWSFVGHDNLWNLIPADADTNSSKGDRLPNEKFMEGLVKAHCRALSIRAKHFPTKWGKLVESYSADLKLPFEDLTNEPRMRNAYKMFIPPLIDLAKANGFSKWDYKPRLHR